MSSAPPTRAPWVGWGVAVLLVGLAFAVPPLFGWDVAARSDDRDLAPLHGFVDAKVGVGTVSAVLLALLGVRYAAWLAASLRWRWLLFGVFVASFGWLLSLALVDGTDGLSRVLGNPYEYLETARSVQAGGSLGATLEEWVDRIPYAHPDNWVTHVAGHPPLALLFFVGLVAIGLGGDLAAGVVVTVVAATIAPAVLVAVRALEPSEVLARRVAPFLVLGPSAVFLAVSADAVFAAVAAWGLAALALAAAAAGRRSSLVVVGWSVVAGLLLGSCVLLSYGLPLLGPLALAVLFVARSWRPLPIAVLAALVPVLVLAAAGFAWWEAFPVLRERYWDGIAADRPAAYWMWGNLAALLVCAGPALAAGVACLRRTTDRVVLWLVASAGLAIAVADLSRMSKAEVERIWLPFVPWLLLATAALPDRWQRPALVVQVVSALLLQHLLYTSW